MHIKAERVVCSQISSKMAEGSSCQNNADHVGNPYVVVLEQGLQKFCVYTHKTEMDARKFTQKAWSSWVLYHVSVEEGGTPKWDEVPSPSSGGIGSWVGGPNSIRHYVNTHRDNVNTHLDYINTHQVGEMDARQRQPYSSEQVFSLRKPRDLLTGAGSGLYSVGKGIAFGAVGLVTQPVMGALNEGTKGFFQGIGTGVMDAVRLPVKGVGVGVYQTARGLLNTPSRRS